MNPKLEQNAERRRTCSASESFFDFWACFAYVFLQISIIYLNFIKICHEEDWDLQETSITLDE